MKPPWGINWLRYHAERRDMPHIEAMGYRSFTLFEWMWSDRDFVNELLSVARNDAIFLARDHPLSEQKDDLWKSNPAQKGRNHATEWAAKVQDGRVFTPLDRTFFLGLNEPDSNHYPRQIDAYNEAFCRRMAEHGLRVAAYSFGVGHPATVDLKPSTLPDWSHYQASALAIREGSHIAAVHEYGAPDGYGWGHWCNRIQHCPYEFDVIFDECGIDYGVVNSGELYGWAKFIKADEYLQWLDGFQTGMAERAHTRKVNILGYNIFSFDHGSGENKDWHSFSIKPLIGKIEHFEWSQPSDPNQRTNTATQDDHTTRLPNVQSGNVQPTAAPEQPGDKWQRSIAFVLKQEGGLSTDPNDPGNYVDGKFVGTKYGISANAHPDLDIPNLTLDEARQIYFDNYWLPSGARDMSWPMCLAVLDLAVNGGVGRAQQALNEAGQDFVRYMAWRIDWYTRIANFERYGGAWIRRCAELMRAATE